MSQRTLSLPAWDHHVPDEKEFKAVYGKCRRIYDQKRPELERSLPYGTFVAVDSQSGVITLGKGDDDELTVWDAHCRSLPHKDIKKSVIFRIGEN